MNGIIYQNAILYCGVTMGKNNNIQAHNVKRVKRLKKLIISFSAFMLLVPSILCILSYIRVVQLEEELNKYIVKEEEFKVDNDDNLTVTPGKFYEAGDPIRLVNPAVDSIYDYEYAVEEDSSYSDSYNSPDYTVKKSGTVDPYEGMIKIYLTFDDGPSYNTDNILDILDDYGIKATFFVNGHEGYEAQYLRIVNDGHSIGMHSFTHVYKDVYKDLDSFADDLYRIQNYIKDLTGVEAKIYRFPGGSSNRVGRVSMKDCAAYLDAKGIRYYDWNVSSQDAVSGGASVTTIVNNVLGQIYNCKEDTIVVLMHDSGDKTSTVEALPIIIERLAEMDNVVLLPITDDTALVQHNFN